tara:strand:- start:521 stop:664 length:144 start_codon:yes stop_codon:yes gene_type:complete
MSGAAKAEFVAVQHHIGTSLREDHVMPLFIEVEEVTRKRKRDSHATC